MAERLPETEIRGLIETIASNGIGAGAGQPLLKDVIKARNRLIELLGEKGASEAIGVKRTFYLRGQRTEGENFRNYISEQINRERAEDFFAELEARHRHNSE